MCMLHGLIPSGAMVFWSSFEVILAQSSLLSHPPTPIYIDRYYSRSVSVDRRVFLPQRHIPKY